MTLKHTVSQNKHLLFQQEELEIQQLQCKKKKRCETSNTGEKKKRKENQSARPGGTKKTIPFLAFLLLMYFTEVASRWHSTFGLHGKETERESTTEREREREREREIFL